MVVEDYLSSLLSFPLKKEMDQEVGTMLAIKTKAVCSGGNDTVTVTGSV